MSDITKEQVIEFISNISVLELSQLVKELEEKFGVSASAAIVAPMAAGTDAAAETKEEKTEFDVVLTSFGEKKIGVIKEVRSMTGLGLKEAKELVESAGPDCKIKEGLPKEEADSIAEKLKAVGASAEIK